MPLAPQPADVEATHESLDDLRDHVCTHKIKCVTTAGAAEAVDVMVKAAIAFVHFDIHYGECRKWYGWEQFDEPLWAAISGIRDGLTSGAFDLADWHLWNAPIECLVVEPTRPESESEARAVIRIGSWFRDFGALLRLGIDYRRGAPRWISCPRAFWQLGPHEHKRPHWGSPKALEKYLEPISALASYWSLPTLPDVDIETRLMRRGPTFWGELPGRLAWLILQRRGALEQLWPDVERRACDDIIRKWSSPQSAAMLKAHHAPPRRKPT